MTYWCEVRAWQRRSGRPYFVEASKLEGCRGFRSVYAYDDTVKSMIEAAGCTEGMTNVPVYSDELFLDFDNVDPSETLALLYDAGVHHSVWHSGNRSTHVHVELDPMEGPLVPYSQRVWVQQNCPGADLSFYHQAGQYRLPGTLHEKTRKRKTLIHELKGTVLEIPIVVPKRAAPVSPTVRTASSFMAMLLRRQTEPGRRVYVWRLVKTALEGGVPAEEVLAGLRWWNERFCTPPLPDGDLVDRLHQLYR